MTEGDHWEGRLSSSALSTATASFALSLLDAEECRSASTRGGEWLALNANDDGGWGDTKDSPSNPSATLLAWCALNAGSANLPESGGEATGESGEKWLKNWIGADKSLCGESIAEALLKLYGKDRTFSVPILTMCAIAGKLGDDEKNAWKLVPRLPFELSLIPNSLFKLVRFPVVSYAMPALISMGIAGYKNNPSRFPILRAIRASSVKSAMRRLSTIQPSNGGFLEATPLTSFVLMSLIASGLKESSVAKKCAEYLLAQQRDDGSWPIDANLAVWLTTLSVNALGVEVFDTERRREIREWILALQFKEKHPFTNAAPGGWGWTHLPGSVPDADDTAGALLALKKLESYESKTTSAAENGVKWLLNLQNSDGGVPTFCKGWGTLPFDRSSPDITAHAIRAMIAWRERFGSKTNKRMELMTKKALKYLRREQREDGSWIPLWFGSQMTSDQENPVFGTAKVAVALRELVEERKANSGAECNLESKKHTPTSSDRLERMLDEALAFLRNSQNADGGWGGEKNAPSTIEETALAVSALSHDANFAETGKQWLKEHCARLNGGEFLGASPIGLYFASLWYSEKLYPLIFAVEAL